MGSNAQWEYRHVLLSVELQVWVAELRPDAHRRALR
jgi:hypothetical protein